MGWPNQGGTRLHKPIQAEFLHCPRWVWFGPASFLAALEKDAPEVRPYLARPHQLRPCLWQQLDSALAAGGGRI